MKIVRMLKWLGVTALAGGLTGCFPVALHPLYTDNDLAYEPALAGVWADKPDSKETWTFARAGDETKGYRLTIVDEKGRKGVFDARLVKLGDKLFLDFYPGENRDAENLSENYQFLLQPVHTFARVRQIDKVFRFGMMKLDWLKEQLDKNPGLIRHERLDHDRIVLTASTKELQEFVVKCADAAFGDEEDGFVRVGKQP